MTNKSQPNELAKPTIRDTALYRVPIWAYNISVGRFLNKPAPESDDIVEDNVDEAEVASSSSGAEDFELLEKSKTIAQNGNGKAIRRKKSTKGR